MQEQHLDKDGLRKIDEEFGLALQAWHDYEQQEFSDRVGTFFRPDFSVYTKSMKNVRKINTVVIAPTTEQHSSSVVVASFKTAPQANDSRKLDPVHKNATVSISSPQNTVNFKKDAVWKPLLRQFRRYLKKEAISAEHFLKIRSASLKQQGELICEALDLPEEL